MLKQLIISTLAAGLLFLAGCDEDEARAVPVPTNSVIRVIVEHPNLGTGPNFLVKGYENIDAFEARQNGQAVKTASNGLAVLKGIKPGENYVDCRIPGDPALYSSARVKVGFADTTTVTLKLQPEE